MQFSSLKKTTIQSSSANFWIQKIVIYFAHLENGQQKLGGNFHLVIGDYLTYTYNESEWESGRGGWTTNSVWILPLKIRSLPNHVSTIFFFSKFYRYRRGYFRFYTEICIWAFAAPKSFNVWLQAELARCIQTGDAEQVLFLVHTLDDHFHYLFFSRSGGAGDTKLSITKNIWDK